MLENLEDLKVAIVYDRANKLGGAERLLLSLSKIFPRAHLFTSVYNPQTAKWASSFDRVYTSFLQKFPVARSWHKGFGWLMPIVFESFSFENFDLVISVTSEAAKGIITKPYTKHICYMLTPTRYLWSHYDVYFQNSFLRFFSKPIVSYLRLWDRTVANRPDKILSISRRVKDRVKKYYGIDSKVVYPPFSFGSFDFLEKKKFSKSSEFRNKDYYLVVSRLEKYKKIDLVIESFKVLKRPLIIVGVGSQLRYLERISSGFSNIHIVGKIVDDFSMSFYYKNAKALIMPQEEDFGLVSLEAQNFGVPVISYKESGAAETIVNGETGLLFDRQSVDSLVDAICRFDKMTFIDSSFRRNLERFSFDNFRMSFLEEVDRLF